MAVLGYKLCYTIVYHYRKKMEKKYKKRNKNRFAKFWPGAKSFFFDESQNFHI